MKKVSYLIFSVLALIMAIGCYSCTNTTNETTDIDNVSVEEQGTLNNVADLNHEEMMFLVEGAVDAWFFQHSNNYASYEPIVRNTKYDTATDSYIHYIRYRVMNLNGGYETIEKNFNVTFTIDKEGIHSYTVNEM